MISMTTSNVNCYLALSVVILAILTSHCCSGMAKFTNMQCINFNKNFSEFTQCRLRAVKRDVNELTLRVKMIPQDEPPKTISMRWQLMKKASGYKPFLYDISVELCEYLEKRNHPFLNIIFKTFINHTYGFSRCPLTDDIALNNFRFPSKALLTIPLPLGDYGLFGTFGAYGKDLAIIKIYFVLAEF